MGTTEEITSDLYSGRQMVGKPLEVDLAKYEYHNPAVGDVSLMLNRDFPYEEQPRLFQYLRPHTDDPFDDGVNLLQPPPIRVKVRARYRVAWFKTPPEVQEMNPYGGLSDTMDHDGATDPVIMQNPAPAYVQVDGKLVQQSTQATAATYPGDGMRPDGTRPMKDGNIDEDRISHIKQVDATLFKLVDSKGASVRIYEELPLGFVLRTSAGLRLNPARCFPKQSAFANHILFAGFDDYTRSIWSDLSAPTKAVFDSLAAHGFVDHTDMQDF